MKKLCSFLKTENDATSVRGQFFSLFNSLRKNDWKNGDDLKADLLLPASYDYGICIDSAPLIAFVEQIRYNIVEMHREALKNTNEVIWTDPEGYEKQNIDVLSDDLEIGMTANGNVLARKIKTSNWFLFWNTHNIVSSDTGDCVIEMRFMHYGLERL